MRLSELIGKEIIDFEQGIKLSAIDRCDLLFDEQTGKISSLLVPFKHDFMNVFRENKAYILQWQDIKKIGDEIIIIENRHEQVKGLLDCIR